MRLVQTGTSTLQDTHQPMLKSLLAGLCLVAATIVVHALGTTFWIGWLRRRSDNAPRKNIVLGRLEVLSATAVALLVLHMIEVVVWAVSYLLLIGGHQFSGFEQAVYFSTVTFAALGYGDVVIEGTWRLLSAIQAMVGLMVFGWSSALLFAVVQRLLLQDEIPDRIRESG